MFDYHRLSLPAFFTITLALCAIAPLCLFWPPVMRVGVVYLYVPYLAALLWIAIVVMAVRVHRARGLWLLATGVVLLPLTYLHFVFIWGCILFGACL